MARVKSSDDARTAATSSRKRSTTTSKGTNSSAATTRTKRRGTTTPAASSSPRTRAARTPSSLTDYLSREQLAALMPFFELAADIDAVFDCDDAMDPTKRQIGFSRVFRAWRAWRTEVDPTFDPRRRVQRR